MVFRAVLALATVDVSGTGAIAQTADVLLDY